MTGNDGQRPQFPQGLPMQVPVLGGRPPAERWLVELPDGEVIEELCFGLVMNQHGHLIVLAGENKICGGYANGQWRRFWRQDKVDIKALS